MFTYLKRSGILVNELKILYLPLVKLSGQKAVSNHLMSLVDPNVREFGQMQALLGFAQVFPSVVCLLSMSLLVPESGVILHFILQGWRHWWSLRVGCTIIEVCQQNIRTLHSSLFYYLILKFTIFCMS